MIDDLAEFLRDRLDEQEARIRALPPGPWKWTSYEDPDSVGLAGPDRADVLSSCDAEGYKSWIDHDEAFDAYLQDIQPERALAEADAKRRILAQYEDVTDQVRHPASAENRAAARIAQGELQDVLRLFALSYATHCDYREEWRP